MNPFRHIARIHHVPPAERGTAGSTRPPPSAPAATPAASPNLARAAGAAVTAVSDVARSAWTVLTRQGPALWGQLHTFALTAKPDQVAPFLASFRLRLPCGACRHDFDRMTAATPPDLADFFGWTVDRHNEVNQRLGKLQVAKPLARSMWLPHVPDS